MNPETGHSTDDAVTTELVRLLPELAVTLYQAGPHDRAHSHPAREQLTDRQMKAVVYLAHHGSATMGEVADGLAVSPAAASELIARLVDKGVVERRHDTGDRRVVRISLAGPAHSYAEDLQARWRRQLASAFDQFPSIDPETLVAFLRALILQLKGHPEP